MLSSLSVIWTLCLSFVLVDSSLGAKDFNYYRRHQQENAKRAAENANIGRSLNTGNANYRYYDQKTAPYFVEHWPDVHFDTGEFYAGSVSQTNGKRH